MKKIGSIKIINVAIFMSVCLVNFSASQVVSAGLIDDTKAQANKIIFWKNEHLNEISFRVIYPKSLWTKSYFSWVVLGATIVGGGAFTYFTAGAGAPAAATGVSAVASSIAGGGAGSYMAGLSMVGGVVGGNAITGAAILNGISYGIIGGSMGKFAALSAAAKFGVIANVSATVIDGVAILNNDAGQSSVSVRIPVPRDLGSGAVRKIVAEYYENNEKKLEAQSNDDLASLGRYVDYSNSLAKSSKELLEKELSKSPASQENLLVLGILNYTNGNTDYFQSAVHELAKSKDKLKNGGLIDYLMAVSDLTDGKRESAIKYLESSIDQEPYALEPSVLLLVLLSEDLDKNEDRLFELINLMEKEYDADKYVGSYSLLAPYYRLGTVYYNNHRVLKAKEFYQKAYDEISLIASMFGSADKLKEQIKLGIANCYYQGGEKQEASKIFSTLIKDKKGEELESLKAQYAGVK